MRSITIFFLIVVFFTNTFQSKAQSPCDDLSLPREEVRLHLDRNVCLAGETLWFKAWCFLDGQLNQGLSKVLYVEIFDETQKVIAQEKYLLNDNKAAGSIQIPEDVSTKHYFLRAYTRYMRNFPTIHFHYQQITIVNPLLEGGIISVNEIDSNLKENDTSTQQYVDEFSVNKMLITLEKEKYQPRERVDIEISSLKPINAELSTLVRLQGLGVQSSEEMLQQNPWLLPSCQEDPFWRQSHSGVVTPLNEEEQKNMTSQTIDSLRWLPETRGLTISGLVQNKRGKNVAGIFSMVSVLQKTPMLYTGTSDDNGEFTICLHDMQQPKDLFVGTPNGDYRLFVRNDFDPNFPEMKTESLQFDSAFHALLETLSLHQQLSQVYPKDKTQAIFQTIPLQIPSRNVFTPDSRIVLDDFVETATMSSVFEEIIGGVRLRKRKGEPYLSIFNSEEQRSYEEPLVLIDNVPIFNVRELLKIDPVKIEAIEVYNTDYILGDYTFGGIISIISKTDDFGGYKWGDQAAFTNFKTFADVKDFEQVMYEEESRLPDFRPVLYWQPNMTFTGEGSGEVISVFAPDQAGVYEVLVQGFTNSGEACFGLVAFEVGEVINKKQ